jgi:hypothetical protein
MRVPRLLALCLLISLCAATVAAQAPPDKSSGSSQLLPALPQNTASSLGLFQFQLPFLAEGQNLANSTPASIQSGHESNIPAPVRAQQVITLEQNEATCYSIRLYRFVRDNPESDSTRLAGYSTCQRAARFQLRTAEDSREMAPR